MDYFGLWMQLKQELLKTPKDDEFNIKAGKNIEVLKMMTAMECDMVFGSVADQEKTDASEYLKEHLVDELPTVGIPEKKEDTF